MPAALPGSVWARSSPTVNGTATVLASQDLSAGWGMAHSTVPQIPSVNAIGLQVDDDSGRDPLNPGPLPCFPQHKWVATEREGTAESLLAQQIRAGEAPIQTRLELAQPGPGAEYRANEASPQPDEAVFRRG